MVPLLRLKMFADNCYRLTLYLLFVYCRLHMTCVVTCNFFFRSTVCVSKMKLCVGKMHRNTSFSFQVAVLENKVNARVTCRPCVLVEQLLNLFGTRQRTKQDVKLLYINLLIIIIIIVFFFLHKPLTSG